MTDSGKPNPPVPQGTDSPASPPPLPSFNEAPSKPVVQNARKKRVVVTNERKPGGKGPGGKRSRLWRWAKIALISMLALSLVGGVGIGLYIKSALKELPEFSALNSYDPKLGSIIYASDESVIGEFANEKREVIPYENMPKLLILAFVASEDQNFFYHYGVDPLGILRAGVSFLLTGKKKQGASTITMQTARTFALTREKTFKRKIKEILMTLFVLEPNLSKEEILYLYLNQIYLGAGAYGVQAAAKAYYGKNVWELTLAQMAVIAGLPKAPGKWAPTVNYERAKIRQEYVLRRMLEDEYITQAEHDRAVAEDVHPVPEYDPFLAKAPHFTEHVRKIIYDKFGMDRVLEDGLRVYTTVDLDAQKASQNAIWHGLRYLDRRQGWRGPLATVPKSLWNTFSQAYLDKHQHPVLRRDAVYPGLVTEVHKKHATVRVGDVEAELPLSNCEWARKPKPEAFWEYDKVTDLTKKFEPGMVLLVRPTAKAKTRDLYDYRRQDLVERDKLIWDLEQWPKAEASILSKDPESGYVVAMQGGYAFEASEFNRAIQSCRQPGSTFKPIVYTAAIEKGWNPSTIIIDAPVVTEDWKMRWKPENYNSDFNGEVSLRYALVNSVNIPAIKTLDYVGIKPAIEYAHKMGISREIQEDLSIALGSACVSLEEMVNVFSHFPLQGYKPRTVYIKTITDRYGTIIEDNRVYYDLSLDPIEKMIKLEEEITSVRERVLKPTTAFIMSWLLTEVVRAGTGYDASSLYRKVKLDKPACCLDGTCSDENELGCEDGVRIGGKTGTTNDSFDAWFLGFTPHLVTGAWIGHDDNSRHLGKLETGGRAALPIWKDFMTNYLEGDPIGYLRVPKGIVWQFVDPKTGRLGGSVKAPFKVGNVPREHVIREGEADPEEFGKYDMY